MSRSTLPFSTFVGQLKQFDTDFKFPAMREYFDLCFSAFAGLDELYARMTRMGIKVITTAAGTELNFGFRPRRFAGGPGVPPGRYFTVCDNTDTFDDRGTLRDEITAYYGADSGVTCTIFDPKVEQDLLDYLQEQGATSEELALPLYYFVYRAERRTDKNATVSVDGQPLVTGHSVGITYGVRHRQVEVDRIIDLRDPETQEWFVDTFVALELAGEADRARESGIKFRPKAPIESFGDLLLVIVGLETGGGRIFSQAIGHWLRSHGANGLVFPSARSNTFNRVRDGRPTEWGGWSLVSYAGAKPPVSLELFGRMSSWRDPDHDHIHVRYSATGEDRGSFSIRGPREFNLLEFDRRKQIACGLREEHPVASMTGQVNASISHAVNLILAAERRDGRLWYDDVDYMSFVMRHEDEWRRRVEHPRRASAEASTLSPPPTAHQPASPTAPAVSPAVALPDSSGPPSPDYPARFEITYPAELNRWLPLIKWLLIIPHLIVLFFVGIGAFFAAIYGFLAVLFTGRWPRGAFDYLVGTVRWVYRVVAYFHLMTDAYPPFSLADDPNHPVRLNIDYPERIANWRPLVQWLLAIPYLFIAVALYLLTGVLTIVAFFTIVFTKQIPRELYEIMVPGLRWNLRGNAYAYFATERYPPFVWG